MNAKQRLTMNQAAALWARHTGRPRPHKSTLIRWAVRGCRGTRLRAERNGGQWTVTADELVDFHRRINELPLEAVDRTAGPARTAQVQRAIDELHRILGLRSEGAA